MNIAFFDSGAGGLTVLNEALKKAPFESYIYYGDSLNAPYGTKSKEEIRELVLKATDFLSGHQLKALVLACNTATSVVVSELRKKYPFPVIGMEPAVKPAVEDNLRKKVLVCATDLTLREEKLHKLVGKLNATERVDYLSLQKLVMFAEHFEFSSPFVMPYLKEKFSGFSWDEYNSIVLGCTHFLYFQNMIRSCLPPHIHILNGNEGTVNNLFGRITLDATAVGGNIRYYTSGSPGNAALFERYLDYLNTSPELFSADRPSSKR